MDTSSGNWPDYNAHGVSTAASHGAQTGLNQTYGWGTESGSQYCDGGGWNSGVGNNSSDEQNYPYNAVADADAAGKQQQLAAPVAVAAAAAPSTDGAKAARPSLGHLYVCGTAMVLGALAATQARHRPSLARRRRCPAPLLITPRAAQEAMQRAALPMKA